MAGLQQLKVEKTAYNRRIADGAKVVVVCHIHGEKVGAIGYAYERDRMIPCEARKQYAVFPEPRRVEPQTDEFDLSGALLCDETELESAE